MKYKDTVILVFLKPFESGNVKTRLAASVGDKLALDVYRHLVHYTMVQLERLGNEVDVVLCYSRAAAPELIYGSDHHYIIQQGHDLGSRMQHAMEWAHQKYARKLIIGTDCFELTTEIVRQACMMLHKKDVVIGPAVDGGYYLIGMKEIHSGVFKDIPWSSTQTYAATIRQLDELGLDWAPLKKLSDIDNKEDLLQYPNLCELAGIR